MPTNKEVFEAVDKAEVIKTLLEERLLKQITIHGDKTDELQAYLEMLKVDSDIAKKVALTAIKPAKVKRKKVPIHVWNEGGIDCDSEDCHWSRECANHRTAGEFRSEDGFTPRLTKTGDDWFCASYHTKPDPEYATEYNDRPEGHSQNGALVLKKGKVVLYETRDR